MHNKTDEVRAFCSKNRQSHKRNLESLGLVILVAMHRRLVTINNAALAAAASTAIMSIDELSRIAMERCAWLAMGKGPFPLGRMAGLDEGNQLSRGGGVGEGRHSRAGCQSFSQFQKKKMKWTRTSLRVSMLQFSPGVACCQCFLTSLDHRLDFYS